MNKEIFGIVLLTLITFITYGQRKVVIDGDYFYLRDSLDQKVALLSSIKRGSKNQNAIWVTYDRRPGVDPWILESNDKKIKYSEENFINYWKAKGIIIFGALTTYDDCLCAKTKVIDSPDMYLIHFKILLEDWIKMKEFYPDIEYYTRKRKY